MSSRKHWSERSNLSRPRKTHSHVTPTFYDSEDLSFDELLYNDLSRVHVFKVQLFS